jgi:hypothetical protein
LKEHILKSRVDKKRRVWYLDTNDFKIKDNSMLLRIRQEKDDLYSTSLKCRNPDRYISASFDLSSNKQKIKSKFEEEIIRPFSSNFSLSATFQTKNEPDLRSFKDLVSIFPGMSVLKINSNERLNKVNNFEVNELSCQIGNIKFGKNRSTDEMSLEFWVQHANAFYFSLQDNKEFIGSETAKTKTQFAYKYDHGSSM